MSLCRKSAIRLVSLTAISAALATVSLNAQTVHLDSTVFSLPNGLTVVVHEDHKAPVVSINVTYHVGSMNERPGKTGFAHLFEHLMFGGSEHLQGSYIDRMETVGATYINGTTNDDRTNFYETVPASALSFALFAESDRMGHLNVTQATLDLQRGVVQNEKRQREGRPYALGDELVARGTFPAGHPYAHTTIGSMEDLNAASLSDVQEWLRTYYGPSNATLTLAGDITLEQAKTLVEQYFGGLPPGPPVTRPTAWLAKMSGVHTEVAQDRVPEPELTWVWNVPGYGEKDNDSLNLVSSILSSGKNSRLYKRLVYDDQTATSVSADVDSGVIAGQFSISTRIRPGADVKKVRAALEEEIRRFIATGPTAEEMERAKASYEARVLRSLDATIMQANTLAMGQVFRGNPNQYEVSMSRILGASPAELQSAAQTWLSDGVYQLTIVPFSDYKASRADVDRTVPPAASQGAAAKLPRLQRTTLSNGLKVIVAERHELPLVNLSLLIGAGFDADHFVQPGTAQLTASLLTGGTGTYSALQISDSVERLGATLSAAARVDTTMIEMSALRGNLDPSLDLLADVVLHPTFPQQDFDRQQKLQLSRIAQEQSIPLYDAIRELPPLLFGTSHPYGMPLTGSGTTDGVTRLTRADLVRFHDTWFKPGNATLVVVGDTTLESLKPRLERAFASWRPGAVPRNDIPAAAPVTAPQVYLIDKPGAQQTTIIAGAIAPAESSTGGIALRAWNDLLGGTFSGRINMNLRENKHWSYGAQSVLIGTANQRPFLLVAPVQTDKTKESLEEVKKELQGIVGDRPPAERELEHTVSQETRSLPGSLESIVWVDEAIDSMVMSRLPEDYYDTLSLKLSGLTTADLLQAGRSFLNPDAMVWVVVGDRTKIEAGVRELNLGTLHVLMPNEVVTK
jgi:zinc protease